MSASVYHYASPGKGFQMDRRRSLKMAVKPSERNPSWVGGEGWPREGRTALANCEPILVCKAALLRLSHTSLDVDHI